MGKVIISSLIYLKLNDLITQLYKKEYFGFMESALDYADAIYDFIYTIPQQRHKPTGNQEEGKLYCRYRHSRHTTWYITFDIEGDELFVLDIFNNHSADYADFIKRIK